MTTKPVFDAKKDDEQIVSIPLTGSPAELLRNPKIIDQLFKKDADGNLVLNAGIIDGTDVFANNFRYKKNTVQYLLGNVNVTNGGWTNSISAGGVISGNGSNQMSLSLASAASENSNTKTIGYGIVLGETGTQAVNWNSNPSIEFWAKVDIAGTKPVVKVRMGNTPGNAESYIGWTFQVVSGSTRPVTRGYNPGGAEAVAAFTLSSIDASQWHKYRIVVTKTNPGMYSMTWYIDDVKVNTQTFSTEWTTTTTSFSVDVANNIADVTETVAVTISHAQFQQDYS